MTYALYFTLGFPLLCLVVWTLFLAIMRLQEVRDAGKLTRVSIPFAYILLGIGLFLDFSLNIASSVIFLELPHEWVLSSRVSRHVHEIGWRGGLSRWICHNLLDPFDPSGCHCK
jgi:hypothetical protein